MIFRALIEREKQYKFLIEQMVDQNSQLKSNFDSYNTSKDKFISDVIENLEDSNKKENEKYLIVYI